jgi:hypothetical protein
MVIGTIGILLDSEYAMSFDLNKKDTDIEAVVKKAKRDKDLLADLVENLKSKNENIRYNSFKILLQISEDEPKLLYSSWNFLEELLDSKNTYHRSSSAHLIANLTAVDTKNKFEKIFHRYYELLNDSVILAAGITANSGKIAKAKPKLQTKITNILLNIDKTKQKHKDLIKAGTINSFDMYFNESKDKKKIIRFVKGQLSCKSPKTRKKAKEFLKKWNSE